MKSVFSFCLLGVTLLFADPSWSLSYKTAFEKAKKEEKGVMIMLSQKSCDACWDMENIVFDDVNLVEQIENSFVPLYLDVNDDDIRDLSFVTAPTLYFLQSSGETIKRLDGVFNIKELTAALLKIKIEKVVDTPK